MKSSARDAAESTWHQVKGKAKELIGKASNNPDLEAKGKAEKVGGVVQEKVGDVKSAGGK